jgi:hypothetical protein
VRGPFTDTKRAKSTATNVVVNVLAGSRNRDLRQAQIAEIRKLLLRAAELAVTEAGVEEACDLAV